MYLARNVIRCSFPSIAKEFGRKDHTTVIHACQVVERDPELKAQAEALRARVRA
jgi:chromosomal replication initiator protein